MRFYADFLERLVVIIRALYELEKLPDGPIVPYLAGPIPLRLDGEPCGSLVNEIDNEWCFDPETPRVMVGVLVQVDKTPKETL